MRCLGFSVVVLGLSAGVAAAQPNYTMTVGLTKGKPDCQTAANGQPTTTDSLQVRFMPRDKLTISAVKAEPSATVVLAPDVDDQIATINVAALKAADPIKLTATTNKGDAVCEAVKARAGGGGGGESGGAAGAVNDSTASHWWLGEGGARALDALRRTGTQRGLPEDTQFLVYLPSGRPVYPTATSVREGTPVQVVMIQPSQGAPDVEVVTKTCSAFKPFRVAGDDGAVKQSGAGGLDRGPPDYELSARGPYLRCGAGTMSYELQIKAGSSPATTVPQTLDVRPVYSFALVTTLGFDATISHDFQAVAAGDGGSVVARKHDRVGPAILIGGQWMLGGVDYTDMRWYNYVLNPFAAFDAKSPLTGFVVGDTLTLRGGISLAVGLAVHEGARLKGVSVGDTIASGEVPRDATWHEQRLGVFIGVAFDSKVFEALKAH